MLLRPKAKIIIIIIMCIYWILVTIFMSSQILDIGFATTSLYGLAGLERADTEPPVVQYLMHQELQTLPLQPLELDLPLSTVAVERPLPIPPPSEF